MTNRDINDNSFVQNFDLSGQKFEMSWAYKLARNAIPVFQIPKLMPPNAKETVMCSKMNTKMLNNVNVIGQSLKHCCVIDLITW